MNLNNDKLLNSYKNKRMEVIFYIRHVFSKSFITRKEVEELINLIDVVFDDTDEMYKSLKKQVVEEQQPIIKPYKRTLLEVETDIFDELDEKRFEKIKSKKIVEQEETTIIDGDNLEEETEQEEEQPKDEFDFGDEEEEFEEDEEEDLTKSSLKVKEIETDVEEDEDKEV